MSHAVSLSPGGHLFVEPDEQAQPELSAAVSARLTEGFIASSARGLELLAGDYLYASLPGKPGARKTSQSANGD